MSSARLTAGGLAALLCFGLTVNSCGDDDGSTQTQSTRAGSTDFTLADRQSEGTVHLRVEGEPERTITVQCGSVLRSVTYFADAEDDLTLRYSLEYPKEAGGQPEVGLAEISYPDESFTLEGTDLASVGEFGQTGEISASGLLSSKSVLDERSVSFDWSC